MYFSSIVSVDIMRMIDNTHVTSNLRCTYSFCSYSSNNYPTPVSKRGSQNNKNV